MPGGNSIPVYHPTPTGGTNTTRPSSTSGGGGGGSRGGGGGGSKSSGGSSDPLAYAKAQQRKAEKKANERYLAQAETLLKQANALRLALGKKGFRRELKIKLANVALNQQIADDDLVKGYRERVGSLKQAAGDNDKAVAGQTVANLQNRSRERANALSEVAMQGGGESDLLQAQQMSLRNWQANQNEVNRSYFDTLSSINSSLTDLTVDTRTSRINNAMQANADRAQLWDAYYDQRSETLTQLGNVLGQRAEYLGMANEQVTSGKTKKRRKGAEAAATHAFQQASLTAGKAWEDPGVRPALANWSGRRDFEANLSNDNLEATATTIMPKRPEGATLRKWAG